MTGEPKGLWEPDGLGVGVEKDFTNPCPGSVGVSQVRKRDRASEAQGTLCPKGGGGTGKGGSRRQALHAVLSVEWRMQAGEEGSRNSPDAVTWGQSVPVNQCGLM